MRVLAAALLLLLAPALAAAQTAIRPDQICPGGVCATPDITWGPGGTPPGYVIGSTIPWRTDPGSGSPTPLTFTSADAAKTVELTNAGAITATLPDTGAAGFGAGFGFAIQTGAGTLTLSPTGTQKINNLSVIRVGAYQLVSLASRGGNWYATYSLPQPTTQTGANVLADNMTWIPAGTAPAGAPTGACAESTNFFARVWALPATLDGPIPVSGSAGPTNHLKAYDDMICGLVADTDAGSTVWSTFDALYIFATAAATGTSTAVANLNLKAASGCTTNCYTLTPSSPAPTFSANNGYTGTDASAVYLDTGFNAVTAGGHFTSTSAGMMLWSFTDLTTALVSFGAYDGTYATQLLPRNTTGSFFGWIGQTGTNPTAADVPASTGSFIFMTISSSQYALRNGVGLTLNSGGSYAPATFPSLTFYVLNRHDTTTATQGTGRQLGAVSFGAGLPSTMGPKLHTRVCTYLAAVHGSC